MIKLTSHTTLLDEQQHLILLIRLAIEADEMEKVKELSAQLRNVKQGLSIEPNKKGGVAVM